MKTQIIKLGKLEIDLKGLTNFLVEAKKKGYAGGGDYEIIPDDSKQFAFQKGNFYYTDNYKGYYQFSGNEIVRWKAYFTSPIWQMNYFGGMLPKYAKNKELAERADRFLKASLSHVTPEAPFRGPEGLVFDPKQDIEYTNKIIGDIRRFYGKEQMYWKKNNIEYLRIFSLNYHGGLIINKESEYPEYFNMQIKDLELSVRARNCLKTIGILKSSSVIELAQKTSSELFQIRHFGKTTFREIRRRLADIELKLEDYRR